MQIDITNNPYHKECYTVEEQSNTTIDTRECSQVAQIPKQRANNQSKHHIHGHTRKQDTGIVDEVEDVTSNQLNHGLESIRTE